MKAYITCPVSHTNKRLGLLQIIEKIAKKNSIDYFVIQVGGTPKEIFNRDKKQLESCEIIIAEVSERSHGVGIELGIAYKQGLKAILLIEKGNFVTKLAQGMPNTKIIEYKNIEDLEKKLDSELKEIIKKK